MKRILLAVLLFVHPAFADPTARMMVVAANPLAARAGLTILKAGGTAIDAAVVVQAVLGLVEPHASGLGGGAMLLTYDAATHKIAYYDGRETAPAAATPGLFLGPDGKPMGFVAAVLGGRSVGVPGAIAALELAHQQHGHLPWASLFQPAIQLAETGFPVAPRLAKLIAMDSLFLGRQPALRSYFLQNGPPSAGALLKNLAYADTLRQIAARGSSALLRGQIAADIAGTVRADPNPGLMTTDDLAAYHARERDPICGPYRSFSICSAAPPSAGGVALLQTLGLLARFDVAAKKPDSADSAMLILDAERLAMADRDAYLADPDFVAVPLAGLLAPDYIAARSHALDPAHAIANVSPGIPAGTRGKPPQPPQPEHGTSDVAIVDAAGNAVSLTTTIEGEFGAHLMVHGFLLNNELTDFSFLPQRDGQAVANRVQAGKRPRSSMAPAIVLDQAGKLVAVIGSAGGTRIPSYVVQAMLGVLDWKLDPAAALALGHVGSSGKASIEAGTPEAGLLATLKARGEPVSAEAMGSGSSMILVTPGGLVGAADPRRDGAALGAAR